MMQVDFEVHGATYDALEEAAAVVLIAFAPDDAHRYEIEFSITAEPEVVAEQSLAPALWVGKVHATIRPRTSSGMAVALDVAGRTDVARPDLNDPDVLERAIRAAGYEQEILERLTARVKNFPRWLER